MVFSDPAFWRAGAISTITVMSIVLIMLTIDSLAAISAGGSHVPLDPIDLLEFEHRSLKLAQLLLIARLVLEPMIEIELGKREPGFHLHRRCHFTRAPPRNRPLYDSYRYP